MLARGQAQYAAGQFDEAIASMRAVVQLQPGLPDPYHVLALIFQERGDQQRALNSILLSAYFTSGPESRPIWRHVAQLSQREGLVDQAIYAYKRSICRKSCADEDLESMWALSHLYFERGNDENGIHVLLQLFAKTRNTGIACAVARRLLSRHRWREVIELLEGCVERGRRSRPRRVDANVLNMLCEVLLEVRDFTRCANLLIDILALGGGRGDGNAGGRGGTVNRLSDAELTAKLGATSLDLVAKLAAALCQLRPKGLSDEDERICDCALGCAISQPLGTHSDLHVMLVDALLADDRGDMTGSGPRWPRRSKSCSWSAQKALHLLDLIESAGLEEDFRERRAMCLWHIGRTEKAAELLEDILAQPGELSENKLTELRVRAAEAWIEHGRPENADRCLSTLSYEDLQRSNVVPPALSPAQRRGTFEELEHYLDRVARGAATTEQEVHEFKRRFLQVVFDCELDYTRLAKHSSRANWVTSQQSAQQQALTSSQQPPQTPAAASQAPAAGEGGDGEDVVADVAAEEVAVEKPTSSAPGGDETAVACADAPAPPGTLAIADKESTPPTSIIEFKGPQLPRWRRGAPPGTEVSALDIASVFSKTKRRHLGLESIEDAFGFEAYVAFVLKGLEFLRVHVFERVATRQAHAEAARAVEICEMILGNRRLVCIRNPVKRRMLQTLGLKSVSLAFEARLWRIVFKHLRALCDQGNDDGPLSLFARVVFTHAEAALMAMRKGKSGEDGAPWEKFRAYSMSGHRHTYASSVTDVRAWALRKLARQPQSFGLTLICGHFCMTAAKYTLAVAMYSKAHRLVPSDAIACLCLGVAYISFAMSRTAVLRHDLVLKGLAFIQRYQALRQSERTASAGDAEAARAEGNVPDSAIVLRVETSYNLGRALHQLGVSDLAAKAYCDALADIESMSPEATSRCDLSVLRRTCAYNLAKLYQAQGAMESARETLRRHVVF